MGRFLSGGSGGRPREFSQRFDVSSPSIAIPSWARIVEITGCGGGGGGSGTQAGTSAAYAIDHPLLIPNGATTMGVVIGTGGPAGTSGGGGNTDISIGGVNVLRLAGGIGVGGTPTGGEGPLPAFWSAAASAWQPLRMSSQATFEASQLLQAVGRGLGRGASIAGSPQIGGSSPFGAGGQGAQDGVGFGSGGGSTASGAGGNGSPGFVILKFKEAA